MSKALRGGLVFLWISSIASTGGLACDGRPVVGDSFPPTYPEEQGQPPFEDGEPHAFPPASVTIDRDKELLVTDRTLLAGTRSDGANASAPWSFRHVMEQMAPPGGASLFVHDWLATWQQSSAGDLDASLPLDARADVQKELVCPWLRLTADNQCDEACSQCASRVLDLSRAPFRLLAIVNRLDLAETPAGCEPKHSEARLVFVATRPGTTTTLSFNVIFEYGVDGAASGEPSAWHALGALHGDAYASAREGLTRSFIDPATLKQVRTSENLGSARGTSWELRQFEIRSAHLVPVALTNTAADKMNGTAALSDHLSTHASEIFAGDNAIPAQHRTAFSTMPKADFRWSTPDGDSMALRLFGLTTCNGCHAGERGDTTVLPFAHVGTDASGTTIVSRFLSDPSAPESDELGFRGRSLVRRLEGRCGSPESSYAGRRGGGGLPVTTLAPQSMARVH